MLWADLFIMALATGVGVFFHKLAATRAAAFDKAWFDRRRTLGQRFGDPHFEAREYTAGGKTYAVEKGGSGEDAYVHHYEFDERGEQVFDARRNAVLCVVTAQGFGLLLCLAVHAGAQGWMRPDASSIAKGAVQRAVADPRLLRAACDWRRDFDFARDIEPLTPTDVIRDTWPGGAPRSVEPRVNGERHGLAHYTFADGRLYGDIPWSHGRKHGVFTLYREDGTKEMTLAYKNGAPFGLNEWFDASGAVSSAAVYLSEKEWVGPERCGEGASAAAR